MMVDSYKYETHYVVLAFGDDFSDVSDWFDNLDKAKDSAIERASYEPCPLVIEEVLSRTILKTVLSVELIAAI